LTGRYQSNRGSVLSKKRALQTQDQVYRPQMK
jgi:hypothetical protein